MKKPMLMKIAAAVLSVSFLAVSGGITTAENDDTIAALEEKRTALTEKRLALESELEKYKDGIETQDKYLKLYDEKMAVEEEEMNNLSEQIKVINSRINSLDAQIEKKQRDVDKGIGQFKERLRVMYMSGSDSVADVITGSSSFYDILARLEMVQRISEHDNEMISDLCFMLDELSSDKDALEKERAELKSKKEEQESILESLRETYANHKETKEWYEKQAEARAAETDEIRAQEAAAEEELQDYIRKQQEEIAKKMAAKKKKEKEEREAKKAAEAKTAVSSETETKTETTTQTETEIITAPPVTDGYDLYSPADDSFQYDFEEVTTISLVTETEGRLDDPYFTYEWGKSYNTAKETEEDGSSETDTGYGSSSQTGFIWPVPSVRNITDDYGSRYIEEEGSGDFHKGIDINKPGCAGEPIVASAGGVVITASNTGNGYGVHVVIDHGDNIATLYGHMESTTVSVGDEVTQGQVIGYIGQTGYAYGYHCHFEVRVNGQHVDPLDYVSMDN